MTHPDPALNFLARPENGTIPVADQAAQDDLASAPSSIEDVVKMTTANLKKFLPEEVVVESGGIGFYSQIIRTRLQSLIARLGRGPKTDLLADDAARFSLVTQSLNEVRTEGAKNDDHVEYVERKAA